MSNGQKKFQQEVTKLTSRKKLLLHVCCGPCSVYPLILLDQWFDITIYYSNSNIFPKQEYDTRLKELLRYLDLISNQHDIKIVIPTYDEAEFTRKLSRYKEDKEGYRRCVFCYGLRMKETFAYADAHHFDYCTTVMSISNRKNADYINRLGELLEQEYPAVKYLYADFKKDGGLEENIRRNKELDLYHQSYCGCVYSKRR